jgi:hypothetical protein
MTLRVTRSILDVHCVIVSEEDDSLRPMAATKFLKFAGYPAESGCRVGTVIQDFVAALVE